MSKVAVLRTSPETVVEDYGRLMDLAGYREALPFTSPTCLRINISWHVYMPACSTTPWQMHGVIEKLRRDGYDVSKNLIAAQNDTVVVSCREGAVNNHLQPVLDRYRVPIQYLSEPPTEWVRYEPKSRMLVLDRGAGPRPAGGAAARQELHPGVVGLRRHRRDRREDDGLRSDERSQVHPARPRERPRGRPPGGDRDRGRRHQSRELWLPRQPEREHLRLLGPEADLLGTA